MPTLFLVRHAIAEDATDKIPDDQRPLTPEGIKKFRKAAQGFVNFLGKDALSLILTSPLVRARQTAEILSKAARHVPIKLAPALAPPGNLKDLLKQFASFKTGDNIAAVGHEPSMSQWLAEVCFDSPGRVEFKKGAIAAIALEKDKGHLLWLMQPAALRQLSAES